MTEIKTWGDRLAEIPDGTITTSYHVTGAMQDEIDELRARLAQQAEMVEKCMVAMNENADRGMKAEQERDELFSAALAKSQPVEQGKPVRPMSGEPVLGTKTWMEGGVVMTQNLTASDIYKPVPMTEDEFITAVEASGIEVDNVEAAFAIKRIVELFHGIKGATE
ncbi:MAG: hypothetical protein KBG81_09530 [Moraxellaceae bacterium]|nr:hypothetical protein [Moraxellaceae bacterium]